MTAGQPPERLEGDVLGDVLAHEVGFPTHAERVVVVDILGLRAKVESHALSDLAPNALQCCEVRLGLSLHEVVMVVVLGQLATS